MPSSVDIRACCSPSWLQKLEGIAPTDLDAAFSEVLPRILHLMTDVFGNYVVQKFLEHGEAGGEAAWGVRCPAPCQYQCGTVQYGIRTVAMWISRTSRSRNEATAQAHRPLSRLARTSSNMYVTFAGSMAPLLARRDTSSP